MTEQVEIRTAIQMVIDMATSHVDDIESGVDEGIYDANENADLNEKREAIKAVESNLSNLANGSSNGMTTQINGKEVPVTLAYGLVHQVVREYYGGVFEGVNYLGGTTTFNPVTKEKYPWFASLREAIDYLEQASFAGYIQTFVAEPDGSGPSWITAGVHYRKESGMWSL